ncbi:rhomboid family intramembrane serine protease [Aestuariivirga litoralis]|uniref:rhomboid family intramembrane serine protease n=1 Tax=Aestuariivirga litoralis TaxID=2650924 RepID=UPI0018C59BB5|nr:rhomboid family intramembrane serine protease [Aestuariivirga litoralis]
MDNESQMKPGEQPYGASAREPAINLPVVVWAIIAVLLLIHLVIQMGGPHWQAFAAYNFAFIPARFGPAPFPQYPGSAWWSMLTYGLLHADWMHVGTNSLWLAIFSKPVHAHLGNWRYLALLAVSIIGGAVVTLIVHWGQDFILVGISAGVSGLLAGAIPLMYGRHDELYGPDHIRPLKPLQILKDRRALTFTIMWLGLTLLTASSQFLTGQALLEKQVVAWDAHLGGFAVGLVTFYLLAAGVKRKPVHTLH